MSEVPIVKIGDKQKHLKIPDRFVLVTSGQIEEYDKFANVGNPNQPFWQTMESDDIGQPVEDYEAVIRIEMQ